MASCKIEINLIYRGDIVPKVTIVKPVVTEEENNRRKEVLYDILTRILKKHKGLLVR